MKNAFYCITFLLIAWSCPAQAQVTLGLRAGINLANINGKSEGESVNEFYKLIAGINAGLTADFGINENLYFQSGLIYSGKGFRIKRTIDFFSIDARASLNYLEIPLNIGYKTGGFNVFAGPYIAFALSGKIKVGDESEKIKFGNNEEEDEFRGTDIGFNLGLGYEIKNIVITAQYGRGFTNLVVGGDSDNSAHNQVFGFSVGYKFRKK